ncbi:hypothetical protein M8J77_007310 [Diaphorina citri]|nr:hypothetical protein M8J77_007310 [Diaphorina citri]
MWRWAANSTLNTECTRQSRIYLDHLDNNTHWAIRMLDASLVAPTGLIAGDTIQYGSPDQCIHTHIPLPNIRPKYCLPTAQYSPSRAIYPDYYANRTLYGPPYDMEKNVWDFFTPMSDFIRYPRHKFSWGVCVPEVCTAQDIQHSLAQSLTTAFAKHQINFDVSLTELGCYSEAEMESRRLPLAGYLWVCICVVLVLLCIAGTAVEYQDIHGTDTNLNKEEPAKPGHIKSFLSIFSLIRNTRKLCRMDKNPSSIVVIDGMKGFLMAIFIMFHRAMFSMGFAKNLEVYEQALHNIEYFWLSSGTHMLDTFFFISGFLLAWGIIQKLNKNRTLNYSTMILNRVVRMYPMYILIIAFTIWVLPYVGEGPMWKPYAEAESQYCKQSWWQNLLFVSTLNDYGDLCIASSWYVSTDFQLFLISLVLIYVVSKLSTYRAHILIGSLLLAHLLPSLIIYLTNAASLWILSIREMREHCRIPGGYVRRTYNKFYIRIPPYIYGVCAAYFTDYMVKKNMTFTLIQKSIMAIIAGFLSLVIFYIGAQFSLAHHEYNVWEHVIYAIPLRAVWSSVLLTGIVVHQCSGYGVFSSFLANPVLVILGRLSYHLYLINFVIIPLDIYMGQSSSYVNLYLFTLRCCGDILLITGLAYFSTMLIEPPMEEFRKKYLPR